MKETELEEGEARFDENDANIDPDTALSYIDTRLQYVLGHFQQEFEGEVSAEGLGPRFGGYGSFLPAYRHSPTIHSHRKTLYPNKLSSHNNFSLEGVPALLNPVTSAVSDKPTASRHRNVFVDQNVLSFDDMASKDTSLLHGETCIIKKETTTSKLVNPTEQRSLKVRIKVCYDKTATKKDEIYSVLGLLSPSASTGNNSEGSGGPQIESHDIPSDLPDHILDDMTSIFVPGNQLLSPLNESLLCLKIKVMPLLEKGMKTESVDCKQGLTSHLKVKLSSDSIKSEANRVAKKHVPIKKRETKKEVINDLSFGPNSTSKELDESYEQKNVKKLSVDSTGIKQIVCKTDPDVIKHEEGLFKHELQEKTPKNIEKLPSEKNNKLAGIETKENLRSSFSGAMKYKKIASKDVVNVHNSYMDIFDTDNGAMEVANVERNGIPAEVAVSQPIEVGPAAPPDNWVGCDRCEKWRLLPIGIEPDNLPDKWLCSMSTWLTGRNHCDISEDESTSAVQEMNLQLISQNQNSLQYNGSSRGIIGNLDPTNSNVISETTANKFKKIKSRPEGSSSSLIETSHSSVDAQQHSRQKRQRLIETNQPLLENNSVVKAKKLKNKTWSNQHETVALNKIKIASKHLCSSNGDHLPKDSLVISVKRHTENTLVSMKSKLMNKKMEIHAKKRKLKDWQESQLYGNTLESSEDRIKLKDKRLKTGVKESTDDLPFNEVKTLKIKLSASKENLVNTNHEKNNSKKRKGLPVGSVSSSSIRACNPVDISPLAEKNIPRKAHVRTEIPRKDTDASQSQSQSQRSGEVNVKCKEASKIRHTHIMEHATGQSDANGAKDKNERSNFQRVTVRDANPLTGQPSKTRRAEAKLRDTGSPKKNPEIKKDLKKVFVGDISNAKDSYLVETKVEVQAFDGSGENQSEVAKHPGDAANYNAKNIVTDCGIIKDLSVISFLKDCSSSQNASTPFKRAGESKDYADRLKLSGFDYECNDAYFDSALKFLYAASLLEACNADISKSKGVDPINGYTTSAKLSKACAQEYEKRQETEAAALAYKCMEVAYMRIVYCKSLLTRQDLQASMQMVTQGESPSSSVSDVDNLNNQTMDKTMLSKNIAHLGNQLVVKNQANFMRLLDLTSDVSLAMEASKKSQNAYKAAIALLEQSQNNEMMISVKRVVDFSFQDVKEIVFLVQNTREAIHRQGFKGNNRR